MNAGDARPKGDPLSAASCQRVRSYLLERQSPMGGFCFYRTAYLDEPNLSDTWHAVAALRLLGEEPPNRDAIADFVCMQPPGKQPYALYYRTFTLDALGMADPDRAAMIENIHALQLDTEGLFTHADLSGKLERLLFILRLKVHCGTGFSAQQVVSAMLALEHPEGGFGTPPNIIETNLAAAILALCGGKASADTGRFVTSLGGPGYAFRFTENSLAFNLETICAGIECCRLLNLQIAYPADAAAFILACQTGNGGFARAPDSLPGIELTHLALQGLATLNGNVTPVSRTCSGALHV